MHFMVIVEGHTEAKALPDFFGRWLNAGNRLRTKISVSRINLKGGGANLLKRVADKAGDYLTGPRSNPKTIGVIGLLDLYNPSLNKLWPGNATTSDAKRAWGIDRVNRLVDDPKFRMAFAVHEIEAWILSEPEKLPGSVYRGLSKPELKTMEQPETINFINPPSKLLERLYRTRLGKNYKKVTYGQGLFESLDPERAYEKCPHLAALLDDMLKLAEDAGC